MEMSNLFPVIHFIHEGTWDSCLGRHGLGLVSSDINVMQQRGVENMRVVDTIKVLLMQKEILRN